MLSRECEFPWAPLMCDEVDKIVVDPEMVSDYYAPEIRIEFPLRASHPPHKKTRSAFGG
jgi:hypothetical protein